MEDGAQVAMQQQCLRVWVERLVVLNGLEGVVDLPAGEEALRTPSTECKQARNGAL